MTYDIIERSVSEGQPIELYEFSRTVQTWKYTSDDEDYDLSGAIFSAIPIKRSKVEQSQDPGKNPVTVELPFDASFVQQYISSPPSASIALTIRRIHRTDTDDEIVVIWIGRVVNVLFRDSLAIIRCEPIFTALKRPALRRLYQTTCPHVLYGAVCLANKATFQLNATLFSASGTTLQSTDFASEADGYFTGGYIDLVQDGDISNRFILTHVGNTITINLPFAGILNDDDVVVFPGCDHTLSVCVNKFDNVNNFGGQPFIPEKNPFGVVSVF